MLPDETLLKIFSYVSPKDLCHCAQVSHLWSKIAHDSSLWQELHPVRWIFQNDWRRGLDVYEDCCCDSEPSGPVWDKEIVRYCQWLMSESSVSIKGAAISSLHIIIKQYMFGK